jgi:fucose permease
MVKKPLLIAAFLGTFVFGFFSVFWGMIVPSLEKQPWVTSVATILLANSIGLVIGSIISGPAIDKLGNKVVLAAGILLVGAGAFGLGRAGSMPFAFVMGLLVGTGGSGIVTSANALVADVATTDAARGMWANIINNFFAVGTFVGPYALIYLLNRGTSLTQLGTLLGGVCVVLAVYYVVIQFPPPRNVGVSMTAGAGQVLSRGLFWVFALMLLLYVGCEGTVWYWMNKYLTSLPGIDADAAGSAIALFAIGIIVGRIVSSFLLGRKILKPLVCTLLFGVGIAIFYTAVLFASEINTIRVLMTLAGVSMAPMFPTILAAVAINFPKNTGTAIGLAITGGWLGYVFIPPTIGYVSVLRSGLFITSVAAVLLFIVNVVALVVSRSSGNTNSATA